MIFFNKQKSKGCLDFYLAKTCFEHKDKKDKNIYSAV